MSCDVTQRTVIRRGSAQAVRFERSTARNRIPSPPSPPLSERGAPRGSVAIGRSLARSVRPSAPRRAASASASASAAATRPTPDATPLAGELDGRAFEFDITVRAVRPTAGGAGDAAGAAAAFARWPMMRSARSLYAQVVSR